MLARLLCLALLLSSYAAFAAEPDAYAELEPVRLESAHMRVVVVPRLGGRVTELRRTGTGPNHLWLDPGALESYRKLKLGEGHLLLAGGMFDVLFDNGHRGYPGLFQCARYDVKVEKAASSPTLVAVCRRGAVEVTRRMSLGADAPRLAVEVTYRNVSKRPIRTGVSLRAEFGGAKNRTPQVAVPAAGGRLGLYDRCKGMGRVAPGAGWIVSDPGTGEGLLVLFDPEQIEFVRGFYGNAWGSRLYALTLCRKQRELAPGESVSLRLALCPFRTDDEAVRQADGTLIIRNAAARAASAERLALFLRNRSAIGTRHPRGLQAFAPWGLVSLPRVAYARKRPWARQATEYRAGDDVRLTFGSVAFGEKHAGHPFELSGQLGLPDGRVLEASVKGEAGKGGELVFPAEDIGAVAGPFEASYTVRADGRELASTAIGAVTVRYHHRGDPDLQKLRARARDLAAKVRAKRDELDHAARALPWIEKRIEYAENLYEIGDYRYRPFCHGRALIDTYGSSTDALLLFRDAVRCAWAVLAGRDPAAERSPGTHVFCYDLAPYGARVVPFRDAAFRRKLAAFEAKVDALAAKPEAVRDAAWYRALCRLGREAVEHGIRADDGDAAAAARRMHDWLDDVNARLDKWPDDGWKKGKFRFPYGGLIPFYTRNIERYRGYAVTIPSAYNGRESRPVLVDPNSYGSLLPPGSGWDVPRDPDPVTLAGALETYGYFHVGPGHTNGYSRSGNPDDVRRVLKDAAAFLRMDASRVYCKGGSLNADATGNLANSMRGTWAAVAPYSQGAQLWTKKTARLPRVTFQAGREAAVFSRGVRNYRDWGVYDPAIHLGGLYPGVGHCGSGRDMWQFVFEFFARHRRVGGTGAAGS
jgi:hypothetical protein